jgi:2-polyprenyl-3-methyl-5-hydroxy-6-metoxy-1,4-benzoquinol methylase
MIPLIDLIRESQSSHDTAALEAFLREVQLRSGSSKPRILDAGCGAGVDLRWFIARGAQAQGVDLREDAVEVALRSGALVERKDLRLSQFPRAAFDGVWLHHVTPELTPDELHRVLQSLFLALVPGEGVLFVSYPERKMNPQQMGALLQQTGFQRLSEGKREWKNEAWHAYLALRGGPEAVGHA